MRWKRNHLFLRARVAGGPLRDHNPPQHTRCAVLSCALLLALLAWIPKTAAAQHSPISRSNIAVMDHVTLNEHFRALGFKVRGGIARSKLESNSKNTLSSGL